MAIIPKKFTKSLTKRLDKITDKIPGVGLGKELGKEIAGAIGDAGKALGLGPTRADKRKDRTREFHEALRRGDWSHIRKTAEAEGKYGGKGTRFKGLALEALWILQQKEKGHSLEEIRAAIAGSGGAEARGGRLPNLDGSPNTTEAQWRTVRSSSGSAPAAGSSSGGKDPGQEESTSSAPSGGARRAPRKSPTRRTTSGSASPRPKKAKPPCKYGPRDADGYCPKKPAAEYDPLRPFAGSGSKKPCKYGPRDADGYCPKKPAAPAREKARKETKAEKAAKRRLETAAAAGVTKAARYVYKNLGPAGTVKLLAKASLVGAAGVAAYALTKKLLTLTAKNWDDMRYELARGVATARTEARKQNPQIDWEDPLQAEQVMAPFNQYFKERKAIMDKSEAMGVKPQLQFYFDDRSDYAS